MSKTIKETLVMLIILTNIVIGVSGMAFCFQEMKTHAVIALILLALIQPLSWNLINKLSEYKDDKPTDEEFKQILNK